MSSELADGLWQALHCIENADKRWEKLRRTGVTDEDLCEAIRYEWGLGGGQSGPDMQAISYHGGANPRFWFGKMIGGGKPTLQGRRLLAAVRQLMNVGLPGRIRRSVGGQLFLPFYREKTA